MLKVYKECCNQCLLSKKAIVGPKRIQDIINSCIKNQTFFVCHKATIKNETVVCKKFYDTFGHYSQNIRIAQRLNAIQFVDLEKEQ